MKTNFLSQQLANYLTKVLVMGLFLLSGCMGNIAENQTQTPEVSLGPVASVEASSSQSNVVNNLTPSSNSQSINLAIGIVYDYTQSFYQKVEPILPVLQPFPAFFEAHNGKEVVFVGVVTELSDILLARYNAEPTVIIKKPSENDGKNPWTNSEHQREDPNVALRRNAQISSTNSEAWTNFIANVEARVKRQPAGRSDIASAIDRSVTAISEYSSANKYLIIASDLIDSNKRAYPVIPSDVKVLVVGVSADLPVNHILHTDNIQRFESLKSAVSFIINQTNN
jgi:hypothetical protein